MANNFFYFIIILALVKNVLKKDNFLHFYSNLKKEKERIQNVNLYLILYYFQNNLTFKSQT